MRRSTPRNILARIDVSDQCWEWTGPTDHKGYALACYHGRTRRVHRLIYEWLVGPIVSGLTLDHLCRNRKCVNPLHLEPVTSAVNTLRPNSEAPAALNKRKTHCKRGHAFAGDNVMIDKRGYRQCRTCRTAGWNAAYLRRKEARA